MRRSAGGCITAWRHWRATLRRGVAALVLRRGAAGVVVPAVARSVGAAAVHTLTHYEPWAKAQDAAVAKAVTLKRYHGALLARRTACSPGLAAAIASSRRGGASWPNRCRRRGHCRCPRPWRLRRRQRGMRSAIWRCCRAATGRRGFDDWVPGEAGAAARLSDFLDVAADYDTARNLPSKEGSSRLSPHLALGEISIRTVWHAVADAVPAAQAEPYLRELGWRDFAANILDQFPDHGDVARARTVQRHRPFATPRPSWRPGSMAAPATRSSMPGCGNYGRPAGCTIASG